MSRRNGTSRVAIASVAVRGMAGLNDSPLRGQNRWVVHASPDAATTCGQPVGQPGAEPLAVRVGVVGQHLAHGRPRRGHRDRVAEQRAADGDLRLVVVATTGALQHGRHLLGHPVGTQRDARGDRLADRHEVGREPPPPGESAGTDDLGVRLVVGQQRAGTPGHLTQALVEAVVRHQEPDVVGERRLGDHHRHLAGREHALQGVEVVERHDERPRR